MLKIIQDHFQLPAFAGLSQVQHEEEPDDLRIVIKATTADGRSYAVRMMSNSYSTLEDHAGQASLCGLLSGGGLNVPTRLYGSDGRPYLILSRKGREVWATVETWLPGKEPESLTIGLAEQAGEWLGAMHRIAGQAPVPIPFTSGSPWSLFGQEDELDQDAQALETALQTGGAEPLLVRELFALYRGKRSVLRASWSELPVGPVQGDFSLNNLLMDENGCLCGVIDFHLAGTDVFVGHLAGEASFLAYAADKENAETEAVGDRYLEALMTGYERSRPLNRRERSVLNDLIGLRRAFACYQVDEVLGEIKAGNTEQVNQKLKDMILYLQKDYRQAAL
ncbi:phosphotransferase enzyme family protein [Paenibacillus oleatilyticus]|uniref:phosphotransferase enzyme family protein n=1 Tax=Paenibacillus oleatilyticus TaxID=2594886 RepID=UPI001C1FA2A5|nr:phosphotransferase [Paenibacillus oleatilyticus]MBU7316300.1 phosphotransferase [Paenibacillus oleatilyticus]